MWDEIKGKDGIVRQLQWTARVEGSLGVESKCKFGRSLRWPAP